MKKSILKTAPISLALLSVLFIPLTTYAIGVPSIDIRHNGKVQLTGAEVTAVSGDTITGVIKLKNATTSATIKVGASTTVQTKEGSKVNSTPYSLSSIKVGDVINVSGFFTGFTTSLNVTAEKVRNLGAYLSLRVSNGKVESVNSANGTFTMRTNDNKLVTVTTTAATTVYSSNKATTTLAAVLSVNKNVHVQGTLSADGSTLAASSVRINSDSKVKKDKDQKEIKRFFGHWGNKNN